MAVSNWFLYIGIFLCASGIGLVVGAIFIAYWGIKTLQESKCGNSYTENNFTAYINNYNAGNDGPDKTTIDQGVPKEYLSRETLEDNR